MIAIKPDNPIPWVLPSRMHAVETVFEITIYKSKGSEFQHTALLLSSHASCLPASPT